MARRICIASSWRNGYQPGLVVQAREAGHEVYDFRNPRLGEHGFHWSEVDREWKGWTPAQYVNALNHPISEAGFASDFDAMKWADTGVLVLPSGRSAHLEAGYFVGAGKDLFILVPEPIEPELMFKMATGIATCWDDLRDMLAAERAGS